VNKGKTRLKAMLKPFLIGGGALVSLVLVFVMWLVISYFPGFGDETSAYHPFRSAGKRILYLDAYTKRAEKWPVESETLFIDTSFGQTFVRISGPANGVPVVLIHGGNATSLSWLPNVEALAADFRVYAIDNVYDIGRSIYKKKFETEKDMVEWLDEVHDGLGLENGINIVGLSYGGWIASRYVLARPERIERAVLIAPAATVLPFDREFLKYAVLGMLPHRYFARRTMFWLFEDLVSTGDENLKLVEKEIDFIYLGKKCFRPLRLLNPTVLTDAELISISVPVLFLVGENEKIYSAKEAIQRLTEVAPHIQTGLVLDAGHDLTIVQSELVNQAILEFILTGDMPKQASEPETPEKKIGKENWR
jgi:pimeloyl-ACP methyl ester carboxylesterase